MTRRFCDICDAPLTPNDDKPFVRKATFAKNPNFVAIGFIMITNEYNHALTDVCHGCILKVVSEGQPYTPDVSKIATLQPMPAADQKPKVQLFAEPQPPLLPKEPPKIPPPPSEPIFEPSLR